MRVIDGRTKNPCYKLGKEHFAPILEQSLSYLKPETIISGFEACGLHWNPNTIDYVNVKTSSEDISISENDILPFPLNNEEKKIATKEEKLRKK